MAETSEKLDLATLLTFVDNSGLNSIASLTNNPNKQPTRIHKSELPSVPATHYPRIDINNFANYIEQVRNPHETYEVNQRSSYHITTRELTKYKTAIEDAESVLQSASKTYSMTSGTMAERLKSFDGLMSEPGADTIGELGGQVAISNHKTNRSDPPDIDSIPTMFFEKDFNIHDPTVFELAIRLVGSEHSTADSFASNRAFDANGSVHQVLSGYLDVIENYLAREISRRSPSLFAALSTLKELYTETDLALHQIHHLRQRLGELDERQCQPGLTLIMIKRKSNRLQTTLSDVELLARANTMILAIDDMSCSGNVIGALEMIVEMTQRMPAAKSLSVSSQQTNSITALMWSKAGLSATFQVV